MWLYWFVVDGLLLLIVFFYGGGFVLCGIDLYVNLCCSFVYWVCMFVLLVDYWFVFEVCFLVVVYDVCDVVCWVVVSVCDFGVCVGVVVVVGDSVGGNFVVVVVL